MTISEPVTKGDFSIVSLPEEIDLANASEVLEALLSTINRGGTHLVVDAGDVTFIDSSGLNALIRARERTESMDGSFHLVAPSHRLIRLLEISRLDRVLRRVDTVDEAVTCLADQSGDHTCDRAR
jgi:anti-sigma B factor antagonist